MEAVRLNASRPRILIADDHAIFAETLRVYLERTFCVIGTAADGRSMVEEAIKLRPDLVVADISMPLLNGFEAARRIQTQAPNVKFVFLTMHEDPNLAAAAVQLGPVAFILKNSSVRELLEAIEQVLHGRSYMTPKLKAADWVEAKARVRQFSRDLTKRQCDVLQLFAEGRAMKDIGSILKLSTKTVEFHKYRIMRAFNVRSNADLVLFALGLGLIDVEADPKLALKAPSY